MPPSKSMSHRHLRCCLMRPLGVRLIARVLGGCCTLPRVLPLQHGAIKTSRHHSCLLPVCQPSGRSAGQIDHLTSWQTWVPICSLGFSSTDAQFGDMLCADTVSRVHVMVLNGLWLWLLVATVRANSRDSLIRQQSHWHSCAPVAERRDALHLKHVDCQDAQSRSRGDHAVTDRAARLILLTGWPSCDCTICRLWVRAHQIASLAAEQPLP